MKKIVLLIWLILLILSLTRAFAVVDFPHDYGLGLARSNLISPKSLGVGGSSIAVLSDSSIFRNPSNLIFLNGVKISLFRSSYGGEGKLREEDFLGMGVPLFLEQLSFGLGAKRGRYEMEPGIMESKIFYLSLAINLSRNFAFSGTYKRETADLTVDSEHQVDEKADGFNLGALFYIEDKFKIGLFVQDAIPTIVKDSIAKWGPETQKHEPRVDIGLYWKLNPWVEIVGDATNVTQTADSKGNKSYSFGYNLGAEIQLIPQLKIRMGGFRNKDAFRPPVETGKVVSEAKTAGLGLKLGVFSLDYAVVINPSYQTKSPLQSISISLNF